MADQVNIIAIHGPGGTIQFIPDYQASGWTLATPDEINAELAKWAPGGTNYNLDPAWATNYLNSLKQGVQQMTSGTSPYAIDPATGQLTTKDALAQQATIQQELASGNYINIGTAQNPELIPKGSAADVNMQGGTFAQQAATPTAQLPGVTPVNPASTPTTTTSPPLTQPRTSADLSGGTNQSLAYPTQSLQPGMTGDAVKQLQNYLVSKGYMTQDQVNTGYGIYGPQTTAAVLQMQKDLGIDYSSGPGYFGPKTLSALQAGATPQAGTSGGTFVASGGTAGTSGGTTGAAGGTAVGTTGGATSTSGGTSTTGTTGTTAPTDTTGASTSLTYNPNWGKYGLTSQLFSSLNATQQAVIATAFNAANSLYSSTGGTVTLADALKAAATDPTISAQYADMAKLSMSDFQNTLGQIQMNAQLVSQQQQAQFTNEQKALANQVAQAGQAYSGIRGLAQQQLNTQESGIIQSTRSQIQQQLRDAQMAVAQQQGTNFLQALAPAATNYMNPLSNQLETITGGTIPSLTGTAPIGQQQSINQLAQQYVAMGQVPNVVQP